MFDSASASYSRINDDMQSLRISDEVVYRMLEYTCPKLCVDVGASNGQTATQMLKYAPTAKIVAFEPWPNNIEQFKKDILSENVELYEAACTAESGTVKFFCASTTNTGYSSVGYVVKPGAERDPAKIIEVAGQPLQSVVDQHIDFLKIDVQGGEYDVLRGAKDIIDGPGIDMALIEYNNDIKVLELLQESGYALWDLEYLLYQENEQFLTDWLRSTKECTLTTGATAWHGFLKPGSPRERAEWADFVASQRCVQTDLLAIHESFLQSASAAFQKVMENQP